VWRDGSVGRLAGKAKWSLIATASRAGFAVAEILVEGRYETGRETLLKALRLKRGAPILAFDPVTARKRVEALPWITSAVIERRLPDTIHLRLMERRPLALWQRKGRFMLIDTAGKVIPGQRLDGFSNLIVVVGSDAPRHAARLFDILASHPPLARRVKAAVRIGGRRWNLHMDNNIQVRLPERDLAAAWSYLAELERRHGLLAKDVTAVDLRLPDRVIVRPAKRATDKEGGPERDT
jgi:cell division protein FtsQ